MGNILINSTVLEKYFGLLNRFDNSSKKKLIIKLSESLESEKKDSNLKSLFGAWEDSRDADQIIQDVRASRVNKSNIEDFE